MRPICSGWTRTSGRRSPDGGGQIRWDQFTSISVRKTRSFPNAPATAKKLAGWMADRAEFEPAVAQPAASGLWTVVAPDEMRSCGKSYQHCGIAECPGFAAGCGTYYLELAVVHLESFQDFLVIGFTEGCLHDYEFLD